MITNKESIREYFTSGQKMEGGGQALKSEVCKCIISWKEKLPDYEITEINEDSIIGDFNFQKELKDNLWFKTVYERKIFVYIADYVRIKVLYENGGIYFDTDITVLQSFDKFLSEPAFVALFFLENKQKIPLDNIDVEYDKLAPYFKETSNDIIKQHIDKINLTICNELNKIVN